MKSFTAALVTGATGSLGGRLVEKLIEDHQINVHVLVRNIKRATRIENMSVKIFQGDVSNRETIKEAMVGCDVIFHCANDFKNFANNLKAAELLMEIGSLNKVKCLIYVSSMVVYNFPDTKILDETFPEKPFGWEYADNKIACEEMLIQLSEKYNLPVVVLQPAKIYGPYSPAWTMESIRQLMAWRLVIPDNGNGICNAVYLDDVVEALILAATNYTKAVNERILISATPVTWFEFYSAYQKILGTDSLVFLPKEEIFKIISKTNNKVLLHKSTNDPISLLKKTWFYVLYKKLIKISLLNKFLLSIKRKIPAPLFIPDKNILEVYSSSAIVSYSKAEKLIGYKPKIDFRRGMELTSDFIESTNIKNTYRR